MTCRNCGGKLQINKDADQILCQNCGTEYLVSINEGAVSMKLLSQGLEKISVSTDKTAAELALARIKKEKDNLVNVFVGISTSLKTGEAKSLVSNTINSISVGVNEFNPAEYRVSCESLLNKEKKSFSLFQNPDYINDLETMLAKLKTIEKQYQYILEEEKHYLELVRQR